MEIVKSKEIEVKDMMIPDSYVKVVLADKEEFFNSLLEEPTEDGTKTYASHFKHNKILFALGDGIVFIYEEK